MTIETTHNPELSFSQDRPSVITFGYENYRGERSQRRVICYNIFFGHTEYHPNDQWMMMAYDLDKQAYRAFAIRDMEAVRSMKEGE